MSIREQPTWKNERIKDYPKLTRKERTDVVIVGGGLAGILTAYLLNKEGLKVTVLERDQIGSGATEYTTAFITQDIDTDLRELVKMYGPKNARLVWDSHGEAIDLLEDIIKAEKLDCEFMRCSAYVYTISKDGLEELEEEYTTARKMGFEVDLHRTNPFQFKNYGVMETKDQAKFHPLKFLWQLAEKASQQGVVIYENSEAVSVEKTENGWEVGTPEGKISAGKLIVTTYQPFNNPRPTYFKKGMYVSYVFEAEIPQGILPEAIYWDDDNPYNYFRVDAVDGGHDRMVVGGQDHRKEIKMDQEKNFKALEDYLAEFFSGIEYRITRKWNGPILEPSDGLALIGQTYPDQYVGTAFSGNGMTYSGITAMLLTDLVRGRKNPWSEIYDPGRMPTLYQLLKKGRDYTGEFFGGAAANIFRRGRKKPESKNSES